MTHGLCGKEGAMVFKRVLKGIGRLMLTTAVMCGVGLFLCSSEVKAAVDVNASEAEGNFTVTVEIKQNDDISEIKDIQLLDESGGLLYKMTINQPVSSSENISKLYDISSRDFITSSEVIAKDFDGVQAKIKTARVTYIKNTTTEVVTKDKAVDLTSKYIYKATMNHEKINTNVTLGLSFSYENTTVGADIPYGYAGNTIKVTANPTSPYKLENYYRDYYIDGSRSGNAMDWKWSKDTGTMSIELSSEPGKNNYKVTYLPKIEELEIKVPQTGIVDVKVSSATTTTPSPAPKVTCAINSWKQTGENCDKDVEAYIFAYKSAVIDNNTLEELGANTVDSERGSFLVNCKLKTAGEKGSGKVTFHATLPGVDGTMFSEPESEISVPVYLSVPVSGFELNSTTVSLMAGVEQQIDIIKGILPAGANQNLDNYTGSATVTSGNNLIETCTYNNTGGNKTVGTITLKAKSDVTSGTATVQIELKEGSKSLGTKPLEVKIISFSKDNTIKSINKNNKNYITYNKDKGYSLDIKQLIIDNAKDTSDNAVTITKDQITDVYVGSSSCTDGIWKPSEAATNKEVKCKVNDVQIDGIRVSAYPMPTATYSSSNRTLSVKIPTKVATAYSDDNNIRQSKGFKLILEDSSGNTLYEYTDSKYQNVLSSSSESTVTYTVPAADIEGMVTSAASNGKFSADTTSVKFKVIPMGYKQSSTSDETIKAKDEIAGKTDAVTVYKVSASGTNFTSSAAYGLDGQTVSITATPNSGYSFKQWSDGNTSNPRQVKVSASGTRSFQAVAGDRVANSTGAGGTDNSELYDDVPKTAESNSAIWLIVFMVFAVMGTTYALYLQLKAANSKHDR